MQTVETNDEMPRNTNPNPTVKIDLNKKMDALNSKFMEHMDVQHKYKLEQIDIMLDLFERSLNKKLSRILSTMYLIHLAYVH